MRKLTLDLDDIQVESFSTHHAGVSRGTVDARQGRETFTCPAPTQDPSCPNSCGCTVNPGTGMFTCFGTCWDPTCDTCMITCNQATGPERCCA